MTARATGCDFAGFVREHTDALLRTAYLLTGDRSAAEDLVQDTLVHLYPKWARVAEADVPLAYVRRSVANRFINQRRRPSSRELVVDVVPERADPRDLAARFDDRDQLWALLRTLPDRQRAALVLRYFEDLNDDDIAEALQCRAGTVRSLISRGLSDLRAHAPVHPSDRPARGTA
jgi:RNA polymerase sigma-70 factor (sigma-E family)